MVEKRFIVLGLGTFGAALAKKLSENGCRVTGVDHRRERVEDMRDTLYEAVIADASDSEAMAPLSLSDADAVFISLGDNISLSLLAALHAKEGGARRIIVKGVTVEHGKLLEHLGVEKVIFPESESARVLADKMTWPNVIDYLPIDPEYSFVEIAVPNSLLGTTLRDADLRRRTGVWVVGIKDVLTGRLQMFPDGEYVLNDNQLMLVVGKQEDLSRIRDLD